MHIVELVANDSALLREAYCQQFQPAIVRQPGLRAVELLIGRDGERALLLIDFDSDASRMKWVESDLHRQVWGQLAACCAHYSSADFDPLNCKEQG